MNRWLSILLLLSAFAATGSAASVFNLTDADQAALPAEARQEYAQAIEVFGQRQYETGLDHLQRAASLAPDSAKLQFILGEVATNMARRQGPETSQRYLDLASQAYERVTASASASEADRAHAQQLLSELPSVAQTVEQRAASNARRAELETRGRELLEQSAASAEVEVRAAEAEAQRRAAEAAAQSAQAARSRAEAARQSGSANQPETPYSWNRSYQAINDARRLRDASQPCLG